MEYNLTHQQKALLLLGLLVVIIVTICGVLKRVFGTWYLPSIVQQYKDRNLLGQKYERLFKQRETLVYHISWAKSREDFDDAKKLSQDLIALDEQIDIVERECEATFGSQYSNKKEI